MRNLTRLLRVRLRRLVKSFGPKKLILKPWVFARGFFMVCSAGNSLSGGAGSDIRC